MNIVNISNSYIRTLYSYLLLYFESFLNIMFHLVLISLHGNRKFVY